MADSKLTQAEVEALLNPEEEDLGKRYNVLVVEDDVEVQQWLIRFLDQIPTVSTITASTDKEALAQIDVKGKNVDIVLLGYVGLPFNGDSEKPPEVKYMGDYVIEEIKRSNPYTHIIAMTGPGRRDTREHAYEQGADDFLEKPLSPLDLNAAMYRAMRGLNSFYDSLTGLMNRRALDDMFDQEAVRTSRHKQSLTVIMADIDDFHGYNEYGHEQGDEALRQLADMFLEVKRGQDTVARYGGEEFTFILPETNLEGGIEFARKLSEGIIGLSIPWHNGNPQNASSKHYATAIDDGDTVKLGFDSVRMTMGLASYPETTDDLQGIIGSADTALVKGKELGRNTLYVFNQGKIMEHRF